MKASIEQYFKGHINDVEFSNEEIYYATAQLAEAIEKRWPITVSKETIEAIKGCVETNVAINKNFSYEKFIKENVEKLETTKEPEELWISYENSDYTKEVGYPGNLILSQSLKDNKSLVPDWEKTVITFTEQKEQEKQQKIEKYATMTEEEALKLVSSNGTELHYLKKEFRDNEKIVLAAIGNNEDAYRYASERVRDNETIARQAISMDPDNIKYVGKTLHTDTDLYMKAIEKNHELIHDFPKEMQNKREIQEILEKDKRKKFVITINRENSRQMSL